MLCNHWAPAVAAVPAAPAAPFPPEDSKLRNIYYPLQSIAMIESNLLPPERKCFNFNFLGPPTELKPFTMWYRNTPREAMYREQPDTHFRFDLICAFVLFLSLAVVQLIVIEL